MCDRYVTSCHRGICDIILIILTLYFNRESIDIRVGLSINSMNHIGLVYIVSHWVYVVIPLAVAATT